MEPETQVTQQGQSLQWWQQPQLAGEIWEGGMAINDTLLPPNWL